MNEEWDDEGLDEALRGLGTRASDHAPVDVGALLARAALPVPAPAPAVVPSSVGAAKFLALAGLVGGLGGFAAGLGVGARWGEDVARSSAVIAAPAPQPPAPGGLAPREQVAAAVVAPPAFVGPSTAVVPASAIGPASSVVAPVLGERGAGLADGAAAMDRPGRSPTWMRGPAEAPAPEEVAEHPQHAGPAPASAERHSPRLGDSGGALLRAPEASRPSPAPAPREDHTAARSTVHPPPRLRPGAPRIGGRVAVGGAGGLLDWRDVVPDAGPVLSLGLSVEAPRGPLRPVADLRGEFGLLVGPDVDGARAQIGGDAVFGLSVGNDVVRVYAGADAGLRVIPAIPEAAAPGSPGAGWWFVALGPALGARIGAQDGPAFHLLAAAPVALLDLDGDGDLSPAPWLTITGGIHIPFPAVGP